MQRGTYVLQMTSRDIQTRAGSLLQTWVHSWGWSCWVVGYGVSSRARGRKPTSQGEATRLPDVGLAPRGGCDAPVAGVAGPVLPWKQLRLGYTGSVKEAP